MQNETTIGLSAGVGGGLVIGGGLAYNYIRNKMIQKEYENYIDTLNNNTKTVNNYLQKLYKAGQQNESIEDRNKLAIDMVEINENMEKMNEYIQNSNKFNKLQKERFKILYKNYTENFNIEINKIVTDAQTRIKQSKIIPKSLSIEDSEIPIIHVPSRFPKSKVTPKPPISIEEPEILFINEVP